MRFASQTTGFRQLSRLDRRPFELDGDDMQNAPLKTADQYLLEGFADLLMQAGRDRAADAICAALDSRNGASCHTSVLRSNI